MFNYFDIKVSDVGIHIYLANTNEWQTISHDGREVGSSFAICCSHNFIYILGTPCYNYRSSLRFNTYTKTWGRIANMNESRKHASKLIINIISWV